MEILQANRILSNLRSAVVARDRERHTRHVHMTDQDALLLFHAHHEQVPFVLSGHQHGVRWKRLVDTSNAEAQEDRKQLGGGEVADLPAQERTAASDESPGRVSLGWCARQDLNL